MGQLYLCPRSDGSVISSASTDKHTYVVSEVPKFVAKHGQQTDQTNLDRTSVNMRISRKTQWGCHLMYVDSWVSREALLWAAHLA